MAVLPMGAPSVTQANQIGDIYLRGNDTLDGSIRICVTPGDSIAHVEQRARDVWNDTGLRLSAGSIELGRDLRVGSSASFMHTFNEAIVNIHQRALIPHTPYSDSGTGFLHAAILDILETESIFDTAVSETTSTSIGVGFLSTHGRFISSITHEVGTVGATADVEYSVYEGTDNTGILIERKNLPATDFIANTSFLIEFESQVGINSNQNIFLGLSSTVAFSLKTDVSGNILTSFSEQDFAAVGVLTENLMLDENLNLMFDESLNPMYAIQFP